MIYEEAKKILLKDKKLKRRYYLASIYRYPIKLYYKLKVATKSTIGGK